MLPEFEELPEFVLVLVPPEFDTWSLLGDVFELAAEPPPPPPEQPVTTADIAIAPSIMRICLAMIMYTPECFCLSQSQV